MIRSSVSSSATGRPRSSVNAGSRRSTRKTLYSSTIGDTRGRSTAVAIRLSSSVSSRSMSDMQSDDVSTALPNAANSLHVRRGGPATRRAIEHTPNSKSCPESVASYSDAPAFTRKLPSDTNNGGLRISIARASPRAGRTRPRVLSPSKPAAASSAMEYPTSYNRYIVALPSTRRSSAMQDFLRSEHAVFVRRLSRNRLADIPKFDDPPLVVEAKDVHDSDLRRSGLQLQSRMYRDQVAFGDRPLNLKRLVRILHRVLLHARCQGGRVTAEIGIVVAKRRRDILLVCLPYIAGRCHLQQG